MPGPQRSTKDAWLDQFADWPAEVQEQMLDTCALLHRQTVRRTLRGLEAATANANRPLNGQPAPMLLDGHAESEAIG